ncbi:multicopper oxidase family protein [Streptomyces sp. M2CJ-2]|uniref:multicopper oxidase family protein n=1 Tax=Streptomyces sp. M2CJ-2 TaxID=2803948 RepID=UPI001923360A|nr:multicopper oxidase family protein [Streptomyces sp. M2CJ-2]MBL3664871.1 multicopper oxidase family protein [Streptomyces sp. M2CJ-2]
MFSQEHNRQTSSRPRRAVLGAGIAAVGSGLLAACSDGAPDRNRIDGAPGAEPARSAPRRDGTQAPPAETPSSERSARGLTLTATPSTVDLGGGQTVKTWTYSDELPGREVRVTAGETLKLTLNNHLPEATTVHWHGIAVPNDMDGVPYVTQRPITTGKSFTYQFQVPDPGTYWFHPHLGVQIDRGLYAPLIVEDPREPLSYDREWVIVLDDWLDGVDGSTPEDVFAQLRKGKPAMGHGPGHGERERDDPPSRPRGGIDVGHGPPLAYAPGHGDDDPSEPPHGGKGTYRVMKRAVSRLLGGHAGNVDYPYYLINGRTSVDPTQFKAKPGERVRLRIINAGAETAFRVALGGHQLTVTHSDGFPVQHHKVDSLLLGMAERYDVLITVKSGVFPFTALAEGKGGSAMAVLRAGSGATPKPSARPAELNRNVLVSAGRLQPHESVALDRREPDRQIKLILTGGMEKFDWGIDHRPYSPDRIHKIERGERVRLIVFNGTDMWHPVHLHGHTYGLVDSGSPGARKDTSVVLPHHKLVADFDAENPGLWMLHCHNIYHSESGMMTTLGYR